MQLSTLQLYAGAKVISTCQEASVGQVRRARPRCEDCTLTRTGPGQSTPGACGGGSWQFVLLLPILGLLLGPLEPRIARERHTIYWSFAWHGDLHEEVRAQQSVWNWVFFAKFDKEWKAEEKQDRTEGVKCSPLGKLSKADLLSFLSVSLLWGWGRAFLWCREGTTHWRVLGPAPGEVVGDSQQTPWHAFSQICSA